MMLSSMATVSFVAMEISREYRLQSTLARASCSDDWFWWPSERSQSECSVGPLAILWRISLPKMLLFSLRDLLVLPVEFGGLIAGRPIYQWLNGPVIKAESATVFSGADILRCSLYACFTVGLIFYIRFFKLDYRHLHYEAFLLAMVFAFVFLIVPVEFYREYQWQRELAQARCSD
uniref:Pecanex-like protein n=1 Tax=Macrostomum lignano TaxID=282301 RepID=A0A1I8FYW4_9PLAT